MTELEYMEKQIQKHRLNYDRESARGVPEEVLRNIKLKIGYYEAAVKALRLVRCKDCKHWSMGYCNHFAYYSYEPMTNEDDFCSYGERRE